MASIVDDEDVFLQFIEESKKHYSRILKIMNLLLLFLGVLCIVYCVCVLCSGAGHFIANIYNMYV